MRLNHNSFGDEGYFNIRVEEGETLRIRAGGRVYEVHYSTENEVLVSKQGSAAHNVWVPLDSGTTRKPEGAE